MTAKLTKEDWKICPIEKGHEFEGVDWTDVVRDCVK